MNDKSESLKEKLKQALSSTVRVISEDFDIKSKKIGEKKPDKTNFFEVDDLKTKNDFIKARADSDSSALEKKFSDKLIFETFSTTCFPKFSTKYLLCSIFSSEKEWIGIKKRARIKKFLK